MKITGKEGNRLVAYVKNRDVEILFSMKEFVNPELFNEKSILNGDVNVNGYYKITNPENIKYLNQLPYIPEYDTFMDMDTFTLNSIETKNSFDLQRLILMFDGNDEISTDTLAFLNSLSCIDKNVIAFLDSSRSPKEQERARFALKQQIRCYNYSVREMMAIKRRIALQKEEEEKKAKRITPKKVLKKIKSKLNI